MMGFADKVIAVAENEIQRVDITKEVFYHPTDLCQGELMGLINSIEINENTTLFRPNEYRVGGSNEIGVKFQSAVDTGLFVCNYFVIGNNEKIMLTASSILDEVEFIEIVKK